MTIIKKFIVIFFCHCTILTANDIIKDSGTFSFSFSYETYRTSHFWNTNGHRLPSYNLFQGRGYRIYTEYGITAKDTIGVEGAWDKITEAVNGHAMGFNDILLNWKHVLYNNCGSQIAVQMIAIIPPTTEYKPGLRYGKFGAEVGIFYIRDRYLQNLHLWYDFKAGYRYYLGFPTDQIRSHLRFCCLWDSHIQVNTGLFLEYGIFNGKSQIMSNLIAYFPNYRLLTVEIQAALRFFKYAYASIGYRQHAWGNNVGTNGGFFATTGIAF